MATAIYIKEEKLREYVAHLKAMVERGEVEVGKTIFSIAVNDGTQIGPPGMSDATKRNCRQLMMDCDFLSRVGNILSGKGILNNSFSNYTAEQIVELGMTAAEATKGKAKAKKQTHTTTSRNIADEAGAPDVPETIAVPVYDLINVLDDDEKEDLLHQLITTLLAPAKEIKKEIQRERADNQRHIEVYVKELANLREELREVKAQLMDSREALGHAKTHVQPRVVERFVHVPNKPAGARGTGGGSGGYQKGTVVVHRKPLMGHTPKAVREVREKE